MPIRVRCSGCDKTLKVADKFAGKRVRCPGCQGVVQVPEGSFPVDDPGERKGGALPETKAPATAAVRPPATSKDSPQEDDDTYRLSEEVESPAEEPPAMGALPARTVGVKRRPPIDEFGGTVTPGLSPVSSPRSGIGQAEEGRGWRDHLVWVLLLALLPLGISVALPDESAERFAETIRQHPEIADRLENAQSEEDFFGALPDHRIVGAHLPRDTYVHWAYAILAAAAFLVLLTLMFPGTEAGAMRLLWTGLITGTVGIMLLLGFQWVAEFTMGFNLRGRSIIVLLFYLIKLIGFSYRAALDPENGFVLSFLGFTGGVGLCEELCKAVPVMFFLRGSTNAGWRAACLVGMASGIGFGISEGIMYSSDYYNGVAPFLTYAVRFSSCVALHATWAASVAILMRENQDYLFGDGFEWEDAGMFLVHYLSIAMVLHGLYDTLLKRDHEVWALAIAAGSFSWLVWLISNRRRAEAD